MKLDEALSKAVLGCRVARDDMGDGNYLFYDFNGFELKKGKFLYSDEDKAADWYVIGKDEEDVEPHPEFVQTNWNIELAANEQVEETPIYINKDIEAWPSIKR